MSTFWTKLKYVHLYSAAEQPTEGTPETTAYYRSLGNHWESSLRLAYDVSDFLYDHGHDLPALVVFDVQERGARGVELESPAWEIGMFSRAARERFHITAENQRLLAVANTGQFVMERKSQITFQFELPPNLTRILVESYVAQFDILRYADGLVKQHTKQRF